MNRLEAPVPRRWSQTSRGAAWLLAMLCAVLLCHSGDALAGDSVDVADSAEVGTPIAAPPDIEQQALDSYGDVPISALRFIGTHNSYHERPRFLGLPFLPFAVSSKHRYAHPSLTAQLEGGASGDRLVRQLEIDVHMRRVGNQLRVFHLPWVDNRSSCKTLRICLEEIRAWSDAREGNHAPVLIWIEPKDETPLDRWVTLGWYERVDLMRVEEEIVDVLGRDRILAPDDVRRGERTLPEALERYGWPSLTEARGRFIFSLLDEGRHRAEYVGTSPEQNLAGRLMFVRATRPTEPFAATFKINDAVPTLREMQVFGHEAKVDAELAALQVYPEPEPEPEPEKSDDFGTRLSEWWKNLVAPLEMDADEADEEADEEGKEEGKDEGDSDAVDPAEAVAAADSGRAPDTMQSPYDDLSDDAQSKNLDSSPKPEEIHVDRRVRRELESVHAETRPEARERHATAVAELEEEFSLAASPDTVDLAIVLENARRSKPYREVFLVQLRRFLEENERAEILRLVRGGFLVTTTADDPQRSPAENRERAASAVISAAQFISTDALVPRRSDGYVFEFPGSAIRCNGLIDAAVCELPDPATP